MDLIVYILGFTMVITLLILMVTFYKESNSFFFLAFVVFTLLLLLGYNRHIFTNKFKVGDCIQWINKDAESWESTQKVYEKILEVGKNKYKTAVVISGIVDMPKYKNFIVESSKLMLTECGASK